MPLASGTRLAVYEIQAPIGAGGMGEVYRATDTKLGRGVAVKILPTEMAQDPDRLARFYREARAVATLNHPNVVTLYSVEECDGVHFLTMELIEGQPLDRMISASGLPVERIVEIAGAVAEGLAAAHEKGIVHRDLKPANVMVTAEGRVKVVDFGLAKDVGLETSNDATITSAERTQAGIVMGTPAYMSPEQVSGRVLDHRTDIFSLGVMLHEMATGRRPFEGTSSAELVSSILRDHPPLVTDVRPDLPHDLARIIRRCLEKDPRHRLQTARDVSNELRDLAPQTESAPSSTSRYAAVPDSGAARAGEGFWVAVLPFKYSGGSSDVAALGEGLTEDIVTGLSRFSYLKVISRSSTVRYAREAVDVRTAANELGARYVMEGSLRQSGSKIRIAAQLVDASSGAGLWAETYDRAFRPDAAFELLDDVVPRIVSTVADTQGILPHSMTEALRNRDPNGLSPYEGCFAVSHTFSASMRLSTQRQGQLWKGRLSSLPIAAIAGPCCRCYTGKSTRMGSICGLIPSGGRWRRLDVRSTRHRPTTSPITRWRRPCSSGGNSGLSAQRRNAPSPSTPWMDSLPPIWASRLRTPATGSEVALWRNGLRGSIRIIPDGIGSPCSSMLTASTTTKARWTLSSKSTCPPFGERTSRLPQRTRNSANAMQRAMRSGSS